MTWCKSHKTTIFISKKILAFHHPWHQPNCLKRRGTGIQHLESSTLDNHDLSQEVENLWPSRWCWTASCVSSNQHGQYSRPIGILVKQHLEGQMLHNPDLPARIISRERFVLCVPSTATGIGKWWPYTSCGLQRPSSPIPFEGWWDSSGLPHPSLILFI